MEDYIIDVTDPLFSLSIIVMGFEVNMQITSKPKYNPAYVPCYRDVLDIVRLHRR